MDRISSEKQQKCTQHPEFNVEYVRIDNLIQNPASKFFACSQCTDDDDSYNSKDYMVIYRIIQSGSNSIIQKWPPVKDPSILKNLNELLTKEKQGQSIEQQISQYFTDLKEDILKKIDICQKKMLNHAINIPLENSQILERYQEISKVLEFRSILIDNNQDTNQKEKQCSEIIEQLLAEKETNTQKLQDLLSNHLEQQRKIHFELPNYIKSSILSSIENINFFNNNESSESNNNNQQQQNNDEKKFEKLLKLISNKSNYCSETFLKEIREKLEQINPLLNAIKFDSIFETNKQPIDFSQLTNHELQQIETFSIHKSKMQADQQYLNSIKNELEIQQITKILNSKMNFVGENFKEQFERLLIDTYPLLKQVNFNNIFTDEKAFQSLNSISTETVNNVIPLIQKINDIEKKNDYTSSLSYGVSQIMIKTLTNYNQNDINIIFQKYPIFDLISPLPIPKIGDLLNSIELTKTNYNNCQNVIVITKSLNKSEVSVNNKNGNWQNCVSNIRLDIDAKYVFRMQISNNSQTTVYYMIGLMQECNVDSDVGFRDNLSCYLSNDSKQVCYYRDQGISKQLKGDKFRMQNNGMIELRVCIGEKVLEVLDYPNYHYKLGISEEHIHNLQSNRNYKLYIGIAYLNQKVRLEEAFIVNQFDFRLEY